MLTKDQIDNYVSSNINEKTFILFSKLAMLNKLDHFRYIIELLYFQKISYFDLDGLPAINDLEIQKFIDDYVYMHSPNVESSINGDFDTYAYLMLSDNASPINTLLREYNSKRNQLYVLNLFNTYKIIPVYNVCIGKTSGCYQSIDEFENKTNEVMSSLNADFINLDMSDLNIASTYKDSLQNIYQSLFSKELIDILTTRNFYKILINLTNNESYRNREFKKLNELYNFNYYSYNLTNVHNATVSNINTLGRRLTQEEINNLFNDIMSFRFSDYKNSEAFTELMYHIRLLKTIYIQHNVDSSLINNLDLFESEIFKIIDKVFLFQDFLEKINTTIIKNIKISEI